MNHSSRFLQLVTQARSHIQETTAQAVFNDMQNGKAPLLIDVRESSEWVKGHLPGALHLSKGVIERDIEKTIPNVETPIILYCGGGFRSALAAYNLTQMGYTQVISMDGGFSEWIKQGYPVE